MMSFSPRASLCSGASTGQCGSGHLTPERDDSVGSGGSPVAWSVLATAASVEVGDISGEILHVGREVRVAS
jgi:hypothetical protein